MRIALLYDGSSVSRWQARALAKLSPEHELVYLVHETAGPAEKRKLSHALYYGLNLFAIRNAKTRRVPYPVPEGATVKAFVPETERGWSVLPAGVIAWLAEQRVDAVVKFGLNLLRIPPDAPPILSFHHGDPRSYRGRPAGFYELLHGESFVGQIVQALSNELDAGRVLAFAQTRAHAHSYRKTLLEAFSVSESLLDKALDSLAADRSLPLAPTGRNYRLPTNLVVARFALGRLAALARRLAYGLFFEKRWLVSLMDEATLSVPGLEQVRQAGPSRWRTLPVDRRYSFYADPFFASGGQELMVEALDRKTGKGRLVRIGDDGQQAIRLPDEGHFSYPQCLAIDGRQLVLPEVAAWSRPALFELSGERLELVHRLDIDAEAIIDPTLFRHDGRWYLFGNDAATGANELQLWVADSPFGRFEHHPSAPIHLGCRGSRMAGEVRQIDGVLHRFGQDCRSGYGDGVLIFEIEHLGRDHYREKLVAEFAFDEVRGPHTVNVSGRTVLFDWYTDRFSLLAGVRRLKNRL